MIDTNVTVRAWTDPVGGISQFLHFDTQLGDAACHHREGYGT